MSLGMKILKIEPLKIDRVSAAGNILACRLLEKELESWRGTQYAPGYCEKTIGVDCVHFVAYILDKMLGTWHSHSRLPQDTAFHSKKASQGAFKDFLRKYPSVRVRGDVVQPGDVIICGPVGKNGGPGHAMIVGGDRLWHVGHKEVCTAGLAVMQDGAYAFKQVRRLKDRSKMLGFRYNTKWAELMDEEFEN